MRLVERIDSLLDRLFVRSEPIGCDVISEWISLDPRRRVEGVNTETEEVVWTATRHETQEGALRITPVSGHEFLREPGIRARFVRSDGTYLFGKDKKPIARPVKDNSWLDEVT